MNVFKTKVGKKESIVISEDNYKNEFKADAKYWHYDKSGKCHYYAVCPLCDNPIQIIGLYKKHKDGKNPYGKHHKGDIPGIAYYDEDGYYNCYYSHPDQDKSLIRRKPNSKSGIELLDILKTQFDKIVYFWDKSTGIKMSENFAKELLGTYIGDEGWLYYNSNKFNLSFMIIYADHSYPLLHRWIYKDSELYKKLLKIKSITLENVNDKFAKVERKDKDFLKLSFYLTRHNPNITDVHPKETFELVIVEGDEIIITQKIEVDIDYYNNLMNYNGGYRNDRLIAIAKDIIK